MKAEYGLDDLFNVQATMELPDGRTVYLRVLTDAEINQREIECITAAARRERELVDKESEDHKALIAPLVEASREVLAAVILATEEILIAADAPRKYPFEYIPEPDDADEGEKRKAYLAQEEHDALILKRRQEYVGLEMDKVRAGLEELDGDALKNRAMGAVITAASYRARADEFYNQTVHLCARCGGYDGPPFWEYEQVCKHGTRNGLSDKVYNAILAAYGELDRADPWELQKKR